MVLDRDNRSWLGITFITSVNFGVCFSTIWVPFSCAIFPKPLSKGTWKTGTVCFNVGWQWVVSEVLSFSYMQDRIRRCYRRSLIIWCFWWIQCLFKICGDLYTYWNLQLSIQLVKKSKPPCITLNSQYMSTLFLLTGRSTFIGACLSSGCIVHRRRRPHQFLSVSNRFGWKRVALG